MCCALVYCLVVDLTPHRETRVPQTPIRLSFKKASLAKAFHLRPILFPFSCLGTLFNISIKGVAMEA